MQLLGFVMVLLTLCSTFLRTLPTRGRSAAPLRLAEAKQQNDVAREGGLLP